MTFHDFQEHLKCSSVPQYSSMVVYGSLRTQLSHRKLQISLQIRKNLLAKSFLIVHKETRWVEIKLSFNDLVTRNLYVACKGVR